MRRWSVSFPAAVAAVALTFGGGTRAATPEQIADSIEKGVQWLVAQQGLDGSWAGSWGAEPAASTALAVAKLEDRAFELGYTSPFDDAYPQKPNVVRGLNYLFSVVASNGPGTGICFTIGNHETYRTGLGLMAVVASRSPDWIVSVPGSLVDGWTYQQVAQACVDYFVFAQNPDGGWRYFWTDEPSDNSNTGYATLGLRYAEAPPYGFNCVIPKTTKDRLTNYLAAIQLPSGASAYTVASPWPNLLKTGNLLFELSLVGRTTASDSVQAALGYIQDTWNDPTVDPGWRPHHYQAMYCLMKGFTSLDIDTITVGGNPVDWYQEFADVIVANQLADGSWSGDYWGDAILATVWSLFVLEKVAPPPPIKVDIEVPECACDLTGYEAKVTYTVERVPVDGTVTISKDGSDVDTIILTQFSGTATYIMTVPSDTAGTHVWKAVMDVEPSGGGGFPAHAEDKDLVKVCETPQVSGIPDQIAPFESFDLDDYLSYGGGLPIAWTVSGLPAGWTVAIDAEHVVTVLAPDDANDPADLTFTASIGCCQSVICAGSDTATFTPNQPPDCTTAIPSIGMLWPPNNKFVAVQVLGVTDPDGDPVTITITAIRQDEPVNTLGDGNFAPDGQGVGTDTAWLRAERAGTKKVPGDGRVYHVFFSASDGRGGVCTGAVSVGVPHDVKDTPVDGGPIYDSTVAGP